MNDIIALIVSCDGRCGVVVAHAVPIDDESDMESMAWSMAFRLYGEGGR
jgi:hypothetical protein